MAFHELTLPVTSSSALLTIPTALRTQLVPTLFGLATLLAMSMALASTIPTAIKWLRSPGTDWNDCCYYVKSFGILFPRYGNSVEDDPDNSYGK